MHMADALISPKIGGALWLVSAGLIAYSARKLRRENDESKVPLMAVAGAFVFAAQMINFAIPGTGSSGHLGGGLILAILLGPHAALLSLASVLAIQALFFADGGLLALGCNIFNLGFFPAFIAYPFVFRPIASFRTSRSWVMAASVLAAVAGLQLGSFAVVVETLASGITSLDFRRFVLFMQPIHLAIGIIEGIVTAGLVLAVERAKPGIFLPAVKTGRIKRAALLLGALAVTVGGLVSWYASEKPDGLEWALAKVTLSDSEESESGVGPMLSRVQEKIAVMPDYSLKEHMDSRSQRGVTSLAGLLGSGLTLVLIGICGLGIRLWKSRLKAKRSNAVH